MALLAIADGLILREAGLVSVVALPIDSDSATCDVKGERPDMQQSPLSRQMKWLEREPLAYPADTSLRLAIVGQFASA